MGVVILMWVWLKCIGVVNGCSVKRYRFPHITYPYSTSIRSFLQQHLYLVHFSNVFSFFFFMLFLCNIVNVAQITFKIVQKSRLRKHGNIIISTNTLTTNPETSTCEVPIRAL